MPVRNLEELRGYVERISRSRGGLEALPQSEGKLESIALEGDAGAIDPAARGLKVVPTPQLAKAAKSAREKLALGRALSDIELFATEAIIIPDERPAFDVIDGDFVVDHPMWEELNDPAIHDRLLAVIPAVGRIELLGRRTAPYAGTGFVVGPGLLMTNRHVAEIFASGLGDRRIRFRSGWGAGVDFKRERDRPDGPVLEVRKVRMIHPWWDAALLEVPDLAQDKPILSLSVLDARELPEHRIAVIGYPARDPLRNDPQVQDKLFKVYQVKRLQPGEIDGGKLTGSFGNLVSAATHDCSTLGGNSGSAVIDLATGHVLGLHFGGRYLETNYAVPSFELARDRRVVDAGVRLAGPVPGGQPPVWLKAWEGLESIQPEDEPPATKPAVDGGQRPAVGGGGPVGGNKAPEFDNGKAIFEVPLRITVEIGPRRAVTREEVVAAVGAADVTERMVQPRHETDYRNRTGYNPDFITGHHVPMPKPTDPSVLAGLTAGGTQLDYQNFSILMHAERRLALVTASNVTSEMQLRRPDPSKRYTRDALGGLSENDREVWFPDERLDKRYQLSDVFFTRDSGAFDKGHIVRREDVAWGRDYDTVVRANGDTFHVTNCSPQIAQFNQSSRGEDNWGDLENLVLAGAAQERLSVFAGPVLDTSDQTFVGRGEGGAMLRARIPSRFWKVIVAATETDIAAFGFVLEQSLANVDLEFAVPDNFVRLQVPLTEIEAATGLDFGEEIRAADAWKSETAESIADRGNLVRSETLGSVSAVSTAKEQASPNLADDESAVAGERLAPDTEIPGQWRVARALLKLREQVNARAPRRSKASDGTIGDANHATRNSDHNPWVRDGAMGVVTALDITHDPSNGCDADALAKAIVQSKDSRVKYVIWNRQIASFDSARPWAWRRYSGSNPHTHHFHVSVREAKTAFDNENAWSI